MEWTQQSESRAGSRRINFRDELRAGEMADGALSVVHVVRRDETHAARSPAGAPRTSLPRERSEIGGR